MDGEVLERCAFCWAWQTLGFPKVCQKFAWLNPIVRSKVSTGASAALENDEYKELGSLFQSVGWKFSLTDKEKAKMLKGDLPPEVQLTDTRLVDTIGTYACTKCIKG